MEKVGPLSDHRYCLDMFQYCQAYGVQMQALEDGLEWKQGLQESLESKHEQPNQGIVWKNLPSMGWAFKSSGFQANS